MALRLGISILVLIWLFYLIDRYEVVVMAVMHCKQSAYVINRAIRYALKNFFLKRKYSVKAVLCA